MQKMRYLLILASLLTSYIVSAQECVFLAAESKEVVSDTSFCVSMRYTSEYPLASMQFKANWNPMHLTFIGVNDHGIDGLQYTTTTAQNGFMIFTFFSATDFLSPVVDDAIIDLCFLPAAGIPDTVLVKMTEVEAGNSAGELLDVCFNDGEIIITDDPDFHTDIKITELIDHPNCYGSVPGRIVTYPFFGSSPYSYEWDGIFDSEFLEGRGISGIVHGSYGLTVTDNNGNTVTKIIEVTNLAATRIDAAITGSCSLGEYGSISIVVPQTNPPYDYSWSNGATAKDIDQLTVGHYEVTVTDGSGCAFVKTFYVEESFEGDEPSLSIQHPSCTGSNDGQIEIILGQGYNLPLQYEWSNGIATLSYVNNLEPGLYSVTIIDAVGCVKFLETELVTGIDSVDIVNKRLGCASLKEDNGTARIQIEPQQDEHLIMWEDGVTTLHYETRMGLATGLHHFSVVNVDGCVLATDSVFIQEGLQSLADTYYTCGLDTISLRFQGGGDNLDYSWSPTHFFSHPNDSATFYLVDIFPDSIPVSYTANLRITASGGCTTSYPLEFFVQDDCVWPGDTDDNTQVDVYDLLNIGLTNGETGNARTVINTEWYAQPSQRWGRSIPGDTLDMMYADCNGDGTIDAADTLAIIGNKGLSHHSFDDDEFLFRTVGIPLKLDMPSEVVPEETYSVDIVLGDDQNNSDDVYGLAFSLHYDETVVDEQQLEVTMAGWLNQDDKAWQLSQVHNGKGVMDVAMVRNNQENVSGQGPIGALRIAFLRRNENTDLLFEIGGVRLIDADGTIIPSEGVNSETTLKGISTTDEVKTFNDRVYPNPTNSEIHVQTSRQIETFRLLGIKGEEVYSGRLQDRTIQVPILDAGVYFLLLEGHDGTSRHKVIRL